MVVRELDQLVTGQTIPNPRSKIRATGDRSGGLIVDTDTPYGAFVSKKRSDPIASVTLSEHRFSVFTGRKQKVPVLRYPGEVQVYYWPSVAGAC
jgi:hypothetical protein